MTDDKQLKEFFQSVEEALGFKCYTRIGKGGEGRVFRASDTVVKGAGSYALKLYPREALDKDGKIDQRNAEECIKHMEKTFAQLARIIQEFDSGTVHLAPPLIYFDLHNRPKNPLISQPPRSQAHSAEDSSKQKKGAGTQVEHKKAADAQVGDKTQTTTEDSSEQEKATGARLEHEEDNLVIQLLESLRRPGFRFQVIGLKDGELQTADSETNLANVEPETAIKVHYPQGEKPLEGLCCKYSFMAVVMELFDGSLEDVLDYMNPQKKDQTEKSQKLEAAAADIRNWPWKVKLHSLCGVLMMREATGDGHGDFKPANILFKTCRNTVWWACLCTLSFIITFFCV